MSILRAFWQKICEPLDGYLWHRNISHHLIRPLLRNVILASGFFIIVGGALFVIEPWFFWFGCGMLAMTWIFWSWARFFLSMPAEQYKTAFFRALFLRFGLRLPVFALLLYVALAVCAAPVSAILAGLIGGSFLGLASYAWNMAGHPKP